MPSLSYEFPGLRDSTGNTLRPGGLELTAKGLAACCLAPHSVLLDVGCGAGASLDFFRQKGFRAFGIDLSLPLLDEAMQYGTVLRADAHSLPVLSGSVDAIFCECVLSLVANPEGVLAECARVLRPQGFLVLSDMTLRASPATSTAQKSSSTPYLYGAISVERILSFFSHTGFSLVSHIDYTQKLHELAAKIVWHFGSLEVFSQLWQEHTFCLKNGEGISSTGTATTHTKTCLFGNHFGYTQFIAVKGGAV